MSTPASRDHLLIAFEIVLGLSLVAMVISIFPRLPMMVVSIADVRGWSWSSYAVVCVVSITLLMIIKNRQDNMG